MQLLLICINTWQIANGKIIGVIVVSFFIGLLWTLNVKSVSVGCWKARLIYSAGSALGAGTGLLAARWIYE